MVVTVVGYRCGCVCVSVICVHGRTPTQKLLQEDEAIKQEVNEDYCNFGKDGKFAGRYGSRAFVNCLQSDDYSD